MPLLGTLRRLRSRSKLASPPSSPAASSSPPAPKNSSAQSIPAPQASLRLRAAVTTIGYTSLDDLAEGEASGSEEAIRRGEGKELTSAEEFVAEPEQLDSVLHVKSRPERWSSPPSVATAYSAAEVPTSSLGRSPSSRQPPPPSPAPSSSSPLLSRNASRRYRAKRRASSSSLSSLTSPSLSPSSPLRSPPTSSTSISSSASPNASSSSLSLNLSIATRIDSSGRRVLTSRRASRTSSDTPTATPSRCKRNKDAFGIGDDEEQLWEREECGGGGEVRKAVERDEVLLPRVEALGIGLGLMEGGVELREPRSSLETLHQPEPDFGAFPPHGSSDSTPTPSYRFRPPLAPLQPVSASAIFSPPDSQTAHRPRRISQHQPIQPLYPPPPLEPPSPTKSTLLTRAYSAYASSSSSSSTGTKRRNSLQPRKSLSKRLSGSGFNSSSRRGSTSFGPPMSATLAPSTPPSSFSPHSRRFSAPVIAPLTPLGRSSSRGSSAFYCPSTPSTPGTASFSLHSASMPPTPSSHSHGTGAALLPHSYSMSSASMSSHGHSSTYERLSSGSLSEVGHGSGPRSAVPATPTPTATSRTESVPAQHVRRASVVSFELPPSPSLERRRTQQQQQAQLEKGELTPLAPCAAAAPGAGGWRKTHRRAASDGDAIMSTVGGGPAGMTRGRSFAGSAGWGLGVVGEVRREKLFIANPDSPTSAIPTGTTAVPPPGSPVPPVPPVPPIPSPFASISASSSCGHLSGSTSTEEASFSSHIGVGVAC
ncbi:hypothetical protein JCM8097_000103 [Rhodosporidiobolus ruineniae]